MPFKSSNYTLCQNSNRFRDVATGRHCVPAARCASGGISDDCSPCLSSGISLRCTATEPNADEAEIERLREEVRRKDAAIAEKDAALVAAAACERKLHRCWKEWKRKADEAAEARIQELEAAEERIQELHKDWKERARAAEESAEARTRELQKLQKDWKERARTAEAAADARIRELHKLQKDWKEWARNAEEAAEARILELQKVWEEWNRTADECHERKTASLLEVERQKQESLRQQVAQLTSKSEYESSQQEMQQLEIAHLQLKLESERDANIGFMAQLRSVTKPCAFYDNEFSRELSRSIGAEVKSTSAKLSPVSTTARSDSESGSTQSPVESTRDSPGILFRSGSTTAGSNSADERDSESRSPLRIRTFQERNNSAKGHFLEGEWLDGMGGYVKIRKEGDSLKIIDTQADSKSSMPMRDFTGSLEGTRIAWSHGVTWTKQTATFRST